MSRIVIVARTRMQHGDVCIGGHDLDRAFRGVRLLDRFGLHFKDDSPFQIGDLWNIRYRDRLCKPPHLEDVFVMEQRRLEPVPDLRQLIRRVAHPWTGPPAALFDGTTQSTASGASYIPAKGPLPKCSTGYWLPDRDLTPQAMRGRVRFSWTDDETLRHFPWVGIQQPPDRIEAGSLVRVSLSRLFTSDTAPEGYYVQISGVI